MDVIKNKRSNGFTLIELLMVISIITLLSSMLFSYVGSARAKSRDAVRLSDMKQIGIAANLYYEDNGVLPSSIGALVPNYLSSIPTDPKTGSAYSFTKDTPTKTIVISGNYESDNQIVAIAVGEVDTTTLCNATFASSTGCLGTTISGHIVGVTGGRRSGGSGGSGGSEVVPCGDPTKAECWSPAVSGKAWGPRFITTGLNETTSAANNGSANTATLAAITPGVDDYPAADYCDDLIYGGYSDWYLPAINQLTAGLEAYRTQYKLGDTTWGGFVDVSSVTYLSSTERSISSTNYAFAAYYYSPPYDYVYSPYVYKNVTLYTTRCLR